MSQKRYAYLIGANGPEEQGIEPLHYAVKDIEHLEKALAGYPCDFTKVEKVIASSSSVVATGLELLANACLPSDLLFIHFAGHAFLFDGHLYLICDNTDIRRKLFSSTAIDIDTIKTILGRCRAKHKLLVLDCCHAGAAHEGGAWRGEQALEYALEELKGNANFILSACASNKRTRELEKLEFEHDRGAGFLSWALASACGPEFSTVAQDQALSLTDFWNWLPKVLEAVNSNLPKNGQIPTPKLFGEKELGDDEIWFTERRREARRSSSEDEHRHREELAMLEGEDYLHHYCPGANVEDFDRSKVLEYATRDGAAGRLPSGNLKQLCIQLGLASSLGTPTRAAVLVFHRAPERYIHSALVRVIAKASTNGSYVREQIKGSLGEQIDKALKWIVSNLRTISENTGIAQRVDRCEIPERALRELVVNAIIHRDYRAKENVKIEITPKKVIITNPGRLIPAIVNCDPPFAYRNSHPYNPSLLNVLVEQQWAEGLSRGFEIVQEEFQKYGLPLPEIKNLDNGLVQVTIERPDISAVKAIEANMREAMSTGLPSPTISQALQMVWNVPFRRNPLFTGREDLLDQLHENLIKNKTTSLTQAQAIKGLGGIGKTQVAVEYAYRYRNDYLYILWVNATTRDTILVSFQELAALLELPERDEQDQNIVIKAVKHWFATHDGWLVIFDGADDLTLVEDFLPSGSTGHLLLTTRTSASGTLANSIEVSNLDEQEGMLLLLRRAGVLAPDEPLEQAPETERLAARVIVSEMDGLPLALDQAGAYIEETSCSLAAYLERYHRSQEALLQRRGGTGKEHPQSVAATWSLSFQRIEAQNLLAADLLQCCAFLAPDAIPERLFIDGASWLGQNFQQLTQDESLLDEAIGTLLRFSLIKRKREDRTLSVHRLVQAILRNSLNEQAQQQWIERIVQALDQAFPDVTDYRNWSLCQQLLPHIRTCVELVEQWQLALPEAGRLCNQAGYYLQQRAQYEEAEEFYRRAITIGEKALGSEHPTLAIYFNNLANLYDTQGKYTEAESLYRHAMTLDEQTLGPEHPTLATDLNNLANLYYSQGKYSEAEPILRRAIMIGERALGPEHPTIATRLNNLALLYEAQGRYAEAEPLLRRAITIGEQALGSEHPYVATRLNNLGLLYMEQGKYELAEPLYQRAITIGEKTLGPEHPDLATWLNNLANLYHAQGKYALAEPLYRRALAIKEKMLGPGHPTTAANLNNLANLYYQQGKYEQAEPLYQRAIMIGEQILSSEHPTVATWLNNLAALYADEGKYVEAEPLYQRAIAIAEKALGQDHPSTKAYRQNYEAFLKNKQEHR